MDLKLRGKRALVTGSTAGIGFAIAQGLARERAEVIVNGRTSRKWQRPFSASALRSACVRSASQPISPAPRAWRGSSLRLGASISS
jgi:NAD(P)-dependent dehydrogenase (short-subunit alcohol dehydrogenase family)